MNERVRSKMVAGNDQLGQTYDQPWGERDEGGSAMQTQHEEVETALSLRHIIMRIRDTGAPLFQGERYSSQSG